MELLKSGVFNAVLFQMRFDIAIFKMERRVFLQEEIHGGDDILSFQVTFENALSVAETAGFIDKYQPIARHQMHRFTLQEAVFQFHAVGADVLHGCSTHLARDMGEVFHAMPTLADTETHKIGPVFSGLGTDDDFILIFLDNFYAFGVDVNHEAVKHLVLEKDVVSATEDLGLVLLQFSTFNECMQVVDGLDLIKAFCNGIEAEAVVRFEVDVGFHAAKIHNRSQISSFHEKHSYLCPMKRAIVSVINDLVTDQRVNKSCLALQKAGYEVLLVGRKQRKSPPMDERPYATHRMKLLFEKGPLFYAEYNIRLLFFLLFHRAHLLLSNDLDTILPNYFISRLKGIKMVFDSHEYFTETPELVHRPKVQRIWKRIEGYVVPKLDEMITVCDSIADLFREKYGVKVHVIRNIPPRKALSPKGDKTTLGLPVDKHLLILQGSGINIQRGAEELVQAMAFLDDCFLMIIGGGDVLPILKQMVEELNITDRVCFFPRMPYQQMMAYTQLAELGFCLDKDTNLNYRFSLPNKLFDFIQASVPIVASHLTEIEKIIRKYDLGLFIEDHKPETIAAVIREALSDEVRREQWQHNLALAAQDLCWENEEQKLLEIYRHYD